MGIVIPSVCPHCGGPWIPRDHEYMGVVVLDSRCLYCGESLWHRGVPKKPKRKSGKVKIRRCLGCREPLEWNANRLQKYHNTQCKWLAYKRLNSGKD